jgi:hypothetical protein
MSECGYNGRDRSVVTELDEEDADRGILNTRAGPNCRSFRSAIMITAKNHWQAAQCAPTSSVLVSRWRPFGDRQIDISAARLNGARSPLSTWA